MQELRFSYKAKKTHRREKNGVGGGVGRAMELWRCLAVPRPSRGQVKKLAKLIFAFLASGLKLNSEAQQEVLSK